MRSPGTPNTSTIEGMDSSRPSGSHTKNGRAANTPSKPSIFRHRIALLRSISTHPAVRAGGPPRKQHVVRGDDAGEREMPADAIHPNTDSLGGVERSRIEKRSLSLTSPPSAAADPAARRALPSGVADFWAPLSAETISTSAPRSPLAAQPARSASAAVGVSRSRQAVERARWPCDAGAVIAPPVLPSPSGMRHDQRLLDHAAEGLLAVGKVGCDVAFIS